MRGIVVKIVNDFERISVILDRRTSGVRVRTVSKDVADLTVVYVDAVEARFKDVLRPIVVSSSAKVAGACDRGVSGYELYGSKSSFSANVLDDSAIDTAVLNSFVENSSPFGFEMKDDILFPAMSCVYPILYRPYQVPRMQQVVELRREAPDGATDTLQRKAMRNAVCFRLVDQEDERC